MKFHEFLDLCYYYLIVYLKINYTLSQLEIHPNHSVQYYLSAIKSVRIVMDFSGFLFICLSLFCLHKAITNVKTWALDREVFQNIMRVTAQTRQEQYRNFLRR